MKIHLNIYTYKLIRAYTHTIYISIHIFHFYGCSAFNFFTMVGSVNCLSGQFGNSVLSFGILIFRSFAESRKTLRDMFVLFVGSFFDVGAE